MKRGFTLIELLVVVLIIAILSAVALPQYRIAIEKTKYVRLITSVDAIWKAQQIYYLANGEYATSFDNLDISLQGESRSSNCFSSVLHSCCMGLSTEGVFNNLYCTNRIEGKGGNSYMIFPSGVRKCFAYDGNIVSEKVCLSMGAKYESSGSYIKIYRF